jgi:hypothetical protein
MPSFHMNISTGPKGAAFEHAQYIAREGRFADEEKYGPVIAQAQANFPEWAREERNAFWTASDEFERANGNTYREYELALPRELSREQQIALVERFAEQELGSTRVYQWAIHEPNASDGKPQPHVHLMFSDRQLDGIERGAAQFFKRYNSKNPERGGAQKFSYGAGKEEAARTYEGIRERWATVQNLALEHAGVEARVDHRSLAAQGILDREPELHRGPAVSGIEARGEVSEVGRRQREQRLERAMARDSVVAEVRIVTREEMALERVAVRERRELAAEVTGPERELVLPLVAADRREQLGRAQAAAERRVERRQGLGIGGELKEKLLTQARALRERIGEQLGRVKEWIAERFPDPLQRLKERSRELFDTVVEKAQRAMGRDAGQDQAADKTATPKRGMFDGLNLKAGARTREREAFSEVRLSAVERAPETAQQASQNLNRALDRYARTWSDAMRMPEKNLPILEHQRTAFREASLALDGVQPGASADLHNALTHEPKFYQAMTSLQGKERTLQLRAALDHEARGRSDPNLKAERLVKTWRVLEAERERTSGYENKDARQQVKERMKSIADELKRDPQLESILQRRAQELGIERGSRLDRVLNAPTIERALDLSVRDLGRHRDRGLSL